MLWHGAPMDRYTPDSTALRVDMALSTLRNTMDLMSKIALAENVSDSLWEVMQRTHKQLFAAQFVLRFDETPGEFSSRTKLPTPLDI